MGSFVAVHLYSAKNGRKEHVGKLLAYKDGDVEIDGGAGPLTFAKNEISLVRLRIV